MGKIRCPHCGRFLEDSALIRYGVGTITNTAKFTAHLGLKYGGSLLGGALGLPIAGFDKGTVSKHLARGGSRMGTEVANAIGCGMEDMDGWKHKCPSCGHKW